MLPDPVATPCLSADEACELLGIDRKTGYRAIRNGSFPVPTIRVGRLIKVPTAPLVRLLTGDDSLGEEVHDASETKGNRMPRHVATSS